MENAEDSKPASPANEVATVETEESKPVSDEAAPSEDVAMSDAAANDSAKPAEDKPADSTATDEVKDSDMTDKPDDLPAPKVNGNTDAPASSDPLPGSEVDLQPASLSQLAIESESSAKPSIEVTMQDAPSADTAPSSAKVAREREDDGVDEPAPKRARTEPRDEESAAAEPTTSSAPAETPSQEGSALSTLRKWDNSEINAQQLTAYQRREIRRVLARVKKTKSGMHFRDSVQKLWPALWDSYVAKIEKPTDLSEIDRNVRDPAGPYKTMNDFKMDLLLMYENTLAFNGSAHDVTLAAKGSIRTIWDDVLNIPQEEPAKPKPPPKQKLPRESRAAAHPDPIRKPSTGPSSPAIEGPKSHAPQEAAAALRRASTATEGDRPKRTVRPPKAKDIDYSTKPSRKKLKPELQFAEEVLNEMMHPKNKLINSWFMDAVDAEGLAIPQYYSIIKKPMDLGKVSRMLAAGDIATLKDFEKNVKLIFSNCYTFNGTPDQGNAVSVVAKQLEDFYTSQIKTKDAWLARHAKANAPAPPSNASDDEEEEEEEPEDVAAAGVDTVKEVRELEAKLREESEKLNDLFAADSPNSALINVQQGILRMVQEALLKAKTSQSEFRQKQEKTTKKPSKPSKSKASGGAARKSSAQAHPKKSGGTKKAVKKSLSAAEKDQIATAINDLEYPHLDRAIDIIKRDTGQNVSFEVDVFELCSQLTSSRRITRVNWSLTSTS